jgi:hypothetical protein
MLFRVTSTGPRKLVSHRCDTSQAALEKAMELLCQDADNVQIVVDGKSYSPLEFERLPVH